MPLFSVESAATLDPGEEIVARARLHWMVYRWPFIFFFYGLGMLFVGLATFANIALAFPAAFVIIASLCGAALVSMIRRATEIALTDRRVIFREGFLRGVDRSVPLAEIAAVELKRDSLGRALDFGKLEVVTRDGEKRSIRPLAEASKFHAWLRESIEGGELAAAAAAPESPPEPRWEESNEALRTVVGEAVAPEPAVEPLRHRAAE